MSQPWTSKSSLFQCIFSALPQSGFRPSLAWVLCAHSVAGPAHTSGACVQELRIDAIVLPSLEVETTSSPPRSDSSPVQMVSAPPARMEGSRVAMAVPPSIDSVKRILPEGSHRIQLGELLRFGVTLWGSTPPVAGIV